MKMYAKIFGRLSVTIRNHKLFFSVIIVCVLVVLFIYYPRNVKNLLYTSNASSIVEIVKISDKKTDLKDIKLTPEKQKKLFELCKQSYVRIKLAHINYVNSNEMMYLIILSDSQDTIYFLSSDIISINGTQYKVYGSTLSTKFKAIIESED